MARVLHIYKDFYPPVQGGIERHLNLVCAAQHERHEVRVLVANRGKRTEREIVNGIEIVKAGCLGRFASAPLCPGFPRLLAQWPADVLHFHLPQPAAVLSWLLTKPRGKIVVTWHSDIVRQQFALKFYGPFLRSFLKWADAILPTSPNYLASSPWLQAVRDKCRVIPLGIRLEPFALTAEEKKRARDLRGGERRPIIVFIGRLRYYKGLRLLIDALRELDAPCWIIGDGPEREDLRRRIERANLQDRVFLLGELDDAEAARRLHAADIYCLPSHLRSEAFGLSQVEAMACGLPVVSARLDTGVPFVNPDGVTGLLCEPGDARDLAAKLRTLIADERLRLEFGQNALRRAQEAFNAGLMLERIEQVYQALLSGREPPVFVA